MATVVQPPYIWQFVSLNSFLIFTLSLFPHTINLYLYSLYYYWLNIQFSPFQFVAATTSTAIAASCANIFFSSSPFSLSLSFSLHLFSFSKLISIYIHERDFNICSNKSCCSSLLFGETAKQDERWNTQKRQKNKRLEESLMHVRMYVCVCMDVYKKK